MILFVPESLWVSIIEFYRDHGQLSLGAWWKYLRRLLLSYKWMLLIVSIVVLIRMPEAYAAKNVTVKSAIAYDIPKANLFSSMKGKKPISIPENEVITTEDSEDYLEEDSAEDYEDLMKKENASGELHVPKRCPKSWREWSFLGYGMLVGSRCEFTCDKRLHHVYCSPMTNKCECVKGYPVKIGRSCRCKLNN